MASRRVGPRAIGVALAVALAGLAACAGEELPDAPNLRAKRTPFPFEPEPNPSASGSPRPSPSPTGTALPEAPRDGKLVRTGSGYLEFLADTQDNKLVFLVFPYDSRLAGIRGSISDGTGTLSIDSGTPVNLAPWTDGGEIFFYFRPRLSPGSHNLAITAKVKGITYTGTFTYP